MARPFFYIDQFPLGKEIVLNEDTSKHVVQVLRMREGGKANLTDGKGNLIEAEIKGAHKKHCSVEIVGIHSIPPASPRVTIAISILKHPARFEWFLEKATEIGVSEIVPLVCERSEKQKFRYERIKGICISAMLQSQQTWLPVISDPVKYMEYIKLVPSDDGPTRYIAYCDEAAGKQSLAAVITSHHTTVLIGPEGDFTKDEINLALQNKFTPVSLGETRLRAETAGVAAAVILRMN